MYDYYGDYGDYSSFGDYSTYGSHGAQNNALEGAFAGGLFGILAGISVTVWILLVVCIVLKIIGLWKVFKKAGYEGWESLIYGHNEYVLFRMGGINPVWILLEIFFAPSQIVIAFCINIELA